MLGLGKYLKGKIFEFQLLKIEDFESKSNVVISCHKHNLKPNLVQYIYLISFKIAKKGKPEKKDLPLLKNDITGSEPTIKILDT